MSTHSLLPRGPTGQLVKPTAQMEATCRRRRAATPEGMGRTMATPQVFVARSQLPMSAERGFRQPWSKIYRSRRWQVELIETSKAQ